MLRSILILALAVGTTACASSRAVDNEYVPLRVGVLPISQDLQPGDQVEGAIDMELVLEERALTEAFTAQLRDALFVDAVLLDVPPRAASAAAADANLDPVTVRQREILEAASRAGVDAVIEAQLVYTDTVRSGPNEKLWLNLPLFLIGGPLNWFPNDRSYFVRADLEFDVYDVIALQSGQLRSLEDAAMVGARGSADEIELDVFDRAGGNLGQYALGIVVPGAWLARETDRAQATLADEVAKTLTEDAIRELQRDRVRLIRNNLAPFYPDLELRAADGGYRLAGVISVVGQSAPDLDFLEVEGGGRVRGRQQFRDVQPSFDDDAPADMLVRRYPVELPLDVTSADAVLGLRVRIEDAQGNARTYTYAVR